MSDFFDSTLDKTNNLGAKPILRPVWALLRASSLFAAALVSTSALALSPVEMQGLDWASRLQKGLLAVDAAHSGELGVYVKDLRSGVAVSLRAQESWYLASGVKVPVAVAVLQQVERDDLSLDTQVPLAEADYVDGAGRTNWHPPGSRLTVRYLLEQMLIHSDNTASDLLIRLVGVERVNQLVAGLAPEGFGRVTTLADVRRHTYSGFHPKAFNLSGKDFFKLRQQRDEQRRIQELARLLGVDAADFALRDIDSAFDAYYDTNLNGGRLTAYGELLQAIVDGRMLGPGQTQYLLKLMAQAETGQRRIKAGLPATVSFAHKTGTQHRRICDLGVATTRQVDHPRLGAERQVGGELPRVLIAVCNRDFASLAEGEAALRAVGEAVTASGVFGEVVYKPM